MENINYLKYQVGKEKIGMFRYLIRKYQGLK